MSVSQTATSPPSSSRNPQHAHPSRLARLGAGLKLGLKHAGATSPSSSRPVYTDANEADWYIPYNGPYELPPKDAGTAGASEGAAKGKGKRREVRDSWADFIANLQQADPFARDSMSQTQSGSSGGRQGQGSGPVAIPEEETRGRTRSRAFSSSTNAESTLVSPSSPTKMRARGHTFGQSTAHTRAPVPSFVSLGMNDVGIGESPVPIQRISGHGHDHSNQHHAHFPNEFQLRQPQQQLQSRIAQNPRASHSSFWTFGHGTNRKSAPSIYSNTFSTGGGKDAGRTSSESVFSGAGRPSTSTHQTHGTYVGGVQAQGTGVLAGASGTRDRSATLGERSNGIGGGPTARPRANSAVPAVVTSLSSVFTPPGITVSSIPTQTQQQRTKGKQRADELPSAPPSDQSHSTFSYQHHPYAVAFPSAGHREHSRVMEKSPKSASQERRTPMISLAVPFLSPSRSNLPPHLRTTSSKLLKSSISTPNLRGAAASGVHADAANAGLGGKNDPFAGSGYSSPTGSAKWLSAETWCDALIFPRPRFRVRGAAHVISPPGSPIKLGHETGQNGTPPYSAPLQKGTVKGSQEQQDGRKWPLLQPPSSAPPLYLSTAHFPSQTPTPEAGYRQQQLQVAEQRAQETKSGGGLRPPRPKSFAQDDLALPSPVPSLARVLRENEAFDKERNEWKKLANKSFQNKRARSLSRSRLKAMTHGRKNSVEDAELVTSFATIAASAFHGNQLAKPSISIGNSSAGSRSAGTNSTGINTTSSHSRKSSGASHGGTARGHGQKESWGKSALKTAKTTANATGLCAFNVDVSPVDEKALNLEVAIGQEDERTKFVSLDAARPEEKRDAGEGGVVLIAPHANANAQHQLAVPQPRPAVVFSPSPVPSDHSDASQSSSHSGVGIALSTPTVLVPDQAQFLFPAHPYASAPGSSRDQTIPRPSEYAGPHPTSAKMAEFNLDENALNDVSVRHRLPPAVNRMYAERHPYASAEQSSGLRPSLQVPSRYSIPPPKKMFADVGTGLREVLPDEIQYSPYSPNPPSRNSKRDSDALGVEEALSVAFSHGSIDDLDDLEDEQAPVNIEEEDLTATSATGAQILTAQPAMRSAPQYKFMPQIDEDSVRDSWRDSRDDGEGGNMHFSHTPAASGFSMKDSSPSLSSSPMTSPRLLKKYDETEDFSDLFYRPGHSASNSVRAPSNEMSRPIISREPSGSSEKVVSHPVSRSASVSALTGLGRQLSEEYGSQIDEERRTFGGRNSPDYDIKQDRGQETFRNSEESNALLSHGSPPGANVPLRVPVTRPQSLNPSILVPEDVESSRASSILEPVGTEEGTDVTYRLGEVPALSTPNPVSGPDAHRASAHGSYFGDVEREEDHRPDSSQNLSPLHPQRPSLVPPPTSATDTTRVSYVTSTSSNSRISQLSDFPVPPSQPVMTPGTIIQSYFSLPDGAQEGEAAPTERPWSTRRIRRTTFGGEEEVPSFDVSDA